MFKGSVGKNIINQTISSFEKISADLEKGIGLCLDQVNGHCDTIAREQKSVDELKAHIQRANRIKDKINQIIE